VNALAERRAGTGGRPALGGIAEIHCIHDREKGVVTTEVQVAAVGRTEGIEYDPKQHRIHRCSCCRNLFVDPSDEPKLCHQCNPLSLIHAPAAPLAPPIGPVYG
jgi:hypothetical protein